jgi:two-component sensor histidine kinase
MKLCLYTKSILLFLLILPCFTFAQEKNWKEEMEKSEDAIEQFEWITKTLNEGKKYREHVPAMLDKAMQLARQTHLDSILAEAHLQRGNYYQQIGLLNESWKEYTTSKFIYLKDKKYKQAAYTMYCQSTSLIVQSLPDSLLNFLVRNQKFIDVAASRTTRLRWKSMYPLAYQTLNRRAEAKAGFLELLPASIENGDTQLVLSTYINLGRFYDDFDSSMQCYQKGLAMAVNNPEKKTELLFKIGYAYAMRDDKLRDSALYYYLEAEKNIESLRNPIFKGNIEGAIGDFFINRDENKLALPYLHKAYGYSKDFGVIHATTAAHNLAVCYIGLKERDSAAKYLELDRKGVAQVKDNYQFMLYYHAKAEFASLSGDTCTPEALLNFDKSIAYAIKSEEERVGVSTLITTAQCILKQNPKKMQSLAGTTLGYCAYYYEALKDKEEKSYRFAELLYVYAKLEAMYGSQAKALKLYEELTEELSTIQQTGYIKGLGEAMIKYKSDLKDAEISLLSERERVSTIRSILIIVGLLVVLGIAVVIFVLYRREHRTRQLLDERNHKVEQLLREVHHRVKNNLQIVSSFINIQLDKVVDYEARMALEDTSTRIMALAGLHQSLYRQGDLSKIQINQYIEELCKTLGSGINQNIEINCDLEDLQLNIDQAIPIGLAINELITNALKHAFPQKQHGEIHVELKHKDKWELIVKDNGNGLPENMDPHELQSIGIRLVQDIAERQLNGRFSYYNESGAVFKIEFVPLAA